MFICGIIWVGDGGRWLENGVCMVISFSRLVGDGDFFKFRIGDGEFFGVFFLGDGGFGSKWVGRLEIFIRRIRYGK